MIIMITLDNNTVYINGKLSGAIIILNQIFDSVVIIKVAYTKLNTN